MSDRMTFSACNVSYYGNFLAYMADLADYEELFWKKENDAYVIASLSVLIPRAFLIFHNKSGMETFIWAELFDILIIRRQF